MRVDGEPRWLAVARGELGVAAWPEGQCNPRIAAYHTGTNIAGYDDKASWCSTFVHWCFARVGIGGTGSALARSWLDWGDALDTPRSGCITVLWRESPDGWKGHVGFYLRHDAQQVWLLGGNQREAVCANAYPIECLLAYRWPLMPT
jgi:uncharacterized protein (TIGR02594 family)